MNIRMIRNIKDQETRKELTIEWLQKYITDYDYKCWCTCGLTAHLEKMIEKAQVNEMQIWDGKDDIIIKSFKENN